MRAGSDSKLHTTLERCLIEVERLSRLATDLLLLARADANQLTLDRTVFRFDELVVECVTQLKGLAESRSITIPITLNAAVEVDADESLMRRTIFNVLHNALKFSPPASAVYVTVSMEDGDAVLSIHDTGPGICKEEIPFMFDRFRRAEIARTTKGTGLGLAIAKAVMDAHGGSIILTSEPNEGTTLVLRLSGKA
jgi:two-component system heavy metal sensor histidine kinase CusS